MSSVKEADVSKPNNPAWPKANRQARKTRENKLDLNEGTILCLSDTR